MQGERELTAMYKEYTQLEDMKLMGALNPDSLKRSQKKGTLRTINLIKEKRIRKIKGRTFADGRPQRCYITKEYASSLTISLEDSFTSLIIDSHEGRDVVIFDVPGAYLNADIPEDKSILLNIEGEFVDIMCEVNPKHKKDIRVENRVKVLYLRLLKSLYGCMESALMCYDIYSKTLKPQGFLINQYYRCIENSTIKDKQCKIAWYVDENKV